MLFYAHIHPSPLYLIFGCWSITNLSFVTIVVHAGHKFLLSSFTYLIVFYVYRLRLKSAFSPFLRFKFFVCCALFSTFNLLYYGKTVVKTIQKCSQNLSCCMQMLCLYLECEFRKLKMFKSLCLVTCVQNWRLYWSELWEIFIFRYVSQP